MFVKLRKIKNCWLGFFQHKIFDTILKHKYQFLFLLFYDWFVLTYKISLMWWEVNHQSQTKIKRSRKEYGMWTCFKFWPWKTFSENYRPMRVWLWLVYKFTGNYCRSRLFSEFIQTKKRYPTYLVKIIIQTWKLTTSRSFFLWTKLLEILLLAKYLIFLKISAGLSTFVIVTCHFCIHVLFGNIGINLFHATGRFQYPLKTSENQRFFNVYSGYWKRLVAWNGLMDQCIMFKVAADYLTVKNVNKSWYNPLDASVALI